MKRKIGIGEESRMSEGERGLAGVVNGQTAAEWWANSVQPGNLTVNLQAKKPGIVYIVEDERIVRYHLTMVLEKSGFATKLFASGEEFLDSELSAEPGCVLLDVSLGEGIEGPEVHRKIIERGWRLSVVFVTAYASVPMAVEAMKAGAVDVLLKPVKREALLPAVERAISISASVQQRDREEKGIGSLAELLTDREREVLSWIAAGKLNKEVAYILGITERTVKAHRASIMEKLGVVSVVDLVRFADKLGISAGRED